MDKSYIEIIEYAINNEFDANHLYRAMSEKIESEGTKKILLEIAQDEVDHADALKALIKDGHDQFHNLQKSNAEIMQLSAAISLKKDASLQETLLYAIENENTTFEMYEFLSDNSRSLEAKELFKRLSNFEALHKEKLQKILDDLN